MKKLDRYHKLGGMFRDLEETKDDLQTLMKIRAETAKFKKIQVHISFQGADHKPIQISTATTVHYYIGYLEKRIRILEKQIDRKIDRKWYEFWKLW